MEKKNIMMIIAAAMTVLALTLMGCAGTAPAEDGQETPTPQEPQLPQEKCEMAGGEWIQMPTACVDSCEAQREGRMCAQVLTEGCDCGEGMCWNGESCEPLDAGTPADGEDQMMEDEEETEKGIEAEFGTDTGQGYRDVSAQEAKMMIDTLPDLTIIDVSPAYDKEHIPEALGHYVGDGSLYEAIPGLDESKPYLVYCRTASAARQGAQKLADAGLTVYRLDGDYAAWKDAGYDVAMCHTTVWTSGEATDHTHDWCDDWEYTDEHCLAEDDCHRHRIDLDTEMAQAAGSGPHTHTLKDGPSDTRDTAVYADIDIEAFEFRPETVTIRTGGTVTWMNLDTAEHTATSDEEDVFDSGILAQDESWSHTFEEAGTYDYHCTPHPYMKGTVIVEE